MKCLNLRVPRQICTTNKTEAKKNTDLIDIAMAIERGMVKTSS